VKIDPWGIHDIRGAIGTGMVEIGVQPHLVEAVLNNVSAARAGVAGIYNRAAYEPDKATALARWNERLVAAVELP
jgi:hypothetical protein